MEISKLNITEVSDEVRNGLRYLHYAINQCDYELLKRSHLVSIVDGTSISSFIKTYGLENNDLIDGWYELEYVLNYLYNNVTENYRLNTIVGSEFVVSTPALYIEVRKYKFDILSNYKFIFMYPLLVDIIHKYNNAVGTESIYIKPINELNMTVNQFHAVFGSIYDEYFYELKEKVNLLYKDIFG